MGIRWLHDIAALFYSRDRSRVPALSSGLLDGNPPPRWGAPDEDRAPNGASAGLALGRTPENERGLLCPVAE